MQKTATRSSSNKTPRAPHRRPYWQVAGDTDALNYGGTFARFDGRGLDSAYLVLLRIENIEETIGAREANSFPDCFWVQTGEIRYREVLDHMRDPEVLTRWHKEVLDLIVPPLTWADRWRVAGFYIDMSYDVPWLEHYQAQDSLRSVQLRDYKGRPLLRECNQMMKEAEIRYFDALFGVTN